MKKFRVNFFDIAILALIIITIGSLLWIRISRKTNWVTVRMVISNDEWWWEGSPPQWWYTENLTSGLTAKNSIGETIAEITTVENFDVGAYRRRAYLDIKLKGSYDGQRGIYVFNYQPIQVGKPLELTFGKQNVRGIITYINNGPQVYIPRTIMVKLTAVSPEVANSFKQGLEMKDSEGRILATIQNVSITPSQATEVVQLGEKTQKKFSGHLYKDVVARIQIQTFESGGVSYFVDRAAIKIGETISFQFPQTVVKEAEILSVID
jgi:hypothetical protein